MNTPRSILLSFAMVVSFLCSTAFGQHQSEIASPTISMSFDEIHHIVFPAPIRNITLGNKEYIKAEALPLSPHIVEITCVEEDFPGSTNLVVVTTSGSAYSYTVRYRNPLPGQYWGSILFADGTSSAQRLRVASNKNNATEIFFPSRIIYCRQGNEDVYSVEYRDNSITINTTKERSEQTSSNVFVVDAEQNVYEILVEYGTAHSYAYTLDNGRTYTALLKSNTAELSKRIRAINLSKRNIHAIGLIKNKLELSLTNLYVDGDFVYMAFDMYNNSHIDYDIDFFKAFLRDIKTVKNAIAQEVELNHVHTFGYEDHIPGKQKLHFVLVYNKFTIPDDKTFVLEILEKGGGRHLNLRIPNKYILNAKPLKNNPGWNKR